MLIKECVSMSIDGKIVAAKSPFTDAKKHFIIAVKSLLSHSAQPAPPPYLCKIGLIQVSFGRVFRSITEKNPNLKVGLGSSRVRL